MKKSDFLIRTYSNREHKIVLGRAARLNAISLIGIIMSMLFSAGYYFFLGIVIGLNIFYFFVNLIELSRMYENEKMNL